MKRYYFDYAASTPADKSVLAAMAPYFSEKFGNPGSLHFFGQEAIAAVGRARAIVAEALHAEFNQIIFTSSATEANNLAIKGAFYAARKHFIKSKRGGKPKVIVSAIEHESVLESARALSKEGAEVIYLPVNKDGRLNPKELKEKLDEQTAVVSVMLGNNEIGTIEPVAELAKMIKNFRRAGPYPLFHCDAVQAFQYLNCDAPALGVDALTISSQKIYGPKGAGALYLKDKKLFLPLASGGVQEYGLRAGTENVPAIVGFGAAVQKNSKLKRKEAERVRGLKSRFLREIKKAFSNVEINGPLGGGLPHIVNVFFPAHRAEKLLTGLDLAGFALSAGSACRSRLAEPSYVLSALGHKEERSRGSLRISFGRQTKESDIDKLIQKLKKLVYEKE